jgi:hypothetical protein
MKTKQTIANGSAAIFSLRDLSETDFGVENAEDREGQLVKVLRLATATELGEQDYEYYDIRFEDGTVWSAISGYHLITK